MAIIYKHSLDGIVFYVGMTKNMNLKRPYDFVARTKYWKNRVGNRTPDVEIIECPSSDVFDIEEQEILNHKDTIINISHNPNQKLVRDVFVERYVDSNKLDLKNEAIKMTSDFINIYKRMGGNPDIPIHNQFKIRDLIMSTFLESF